LRVSPANITVESIVTSGAFGTIYKGKYFSGKSHIPVAIKSVTYSESEEYKLGAQLMAIIFRQSFSSL